MLCSVPARCRLGSCKCLQCLLGAGSSRWRSGTVSARFLQVLAVPAQTALCQRFPALFHSVPARFLLRASSRLSSAQCQLGTAVQALCPLGASSVPAQFLQVPALPARMMHFFFCPHKNLLFAHSRVFTVFFSMKMAESEKNRLSKLHFRFRRYTRLIKKV